MHSVSLVRNVGVIECSIMKHLGEELLWCEKLAMKKPRN